MTRQKSERNRCADSNRKLRLETLERKELLAVDGFAPIDGFGNNVDNPEWGSVGEQFVRIAEAAYTDGLSEPARVDGENPRDISNLLSAQSESIVNDRFITSAASLFVA